VIYNEDFLIPTRLFFSFCFFDFPEYKTDNIIYEIKEEDERKNLAEHEMLILIRENF